VLNCKITPQTRMKDLMYASDALVLLCFGDRLELAKVNGESRPIVFHTFFAHAGPHGLNVECAEYQVFSTCHEQFLLIKLREIIGHGRFCLVSRKNNLRVLMLLVLITIGKRRVLNRTCKQCKHT